MNKSTVILCSLPGETLLRMGDENLSDLISSAKLVERRIERGANQQDERRRYSLLCDRLEQEVIYKLATSKKVLSLELTSSSLDLLADLVEQMLPEELPKRLNASFFSPEELKNYTSAFRRVVKKLGSKKNEVIDKELKFFDAAIKKGNCVVILQSVRSPLNISEDKSSGEDEEAYEEERLPDTLTDNSGLSYEEVITKQVEQAVGEVIKGQTGSVNFSNHRHDVLAEVIHTFVYGNDHNSLQIKVIYSDGSEARPFPIYCLKVATEEKLETLRKKFPEIKVGLLSARHQEMDRKMDIYWFRNQEISVTRTLAATDEICYQKSKKLLEDMRDEGGYRLKLYQTGLQPAVIGFYRALTEELMLRAGKKPFLEVVPHYFDPRTGEYKGGTPWN